MLNHKKHCKGIAVSINGGIARDVYNGFLYKEHMLRFKKISHQNPANVCRS